MKCRFALVCLLISVAALHGDQQPAAEQRTFRTEVAMVELVVVVTGEGDQSVLDLTARDFELLEDGVRRPLATVRRLTTTSAARKAVPAPAVAGAQIEQLATNTDVADAPAFVLLLDDLNTSPYDTHRVIRAAQGALRAIPGDALVAVLTTSGTDGTLLTLSRPAPEHIERIRAFRGQLLLAGPKSRRLVAETTPSSVNAPCGVGSGVLQSQDCADPTRTARRARSIAAAAQILGRAGARRKALFWITPDMGISPLDPDGNRRAQRQALLQAVNNDVAVYAVDPRENVSERPEDTLDRPDRRTGGTVRVGPGASSAFGPGGGVLTLETDDMVAVPLTQLARETGGRYITAANDLENVLSRVVEQNTTSYLLAYESLVSRVPGPHSIDVRVLRTGTRVFARRGFSVAPQPKEAVSETEPSPHARILQNTLMGSVPQGRLPLAVHVSPRFADGKHGRAIVTVKLEDGGAHDGAITLVLATVDEDGRVGNQWQGRMAPPPRGAPWEVTTELSLPRGRHQLRVAGVTADGTRTGLVLTAFEIVEPGRALEMTPPVLIDVTGGRSHPTAVRTFASGDPLGVQVEIGGRSVQQRVVRVHAALLDAGGRVVREADAVLDRGAKSDRIGATATLQSDGIGAGEYVLITEAQVTGADARLRRGVPITLRPAGIAAARDATPASADRLTPATAPTGTIPPNGTIPHTVVAHGPTSWHPAPETRVIRTAHEWAAFWKHLPTRQSPPAIDFARVTLLAIVLETDARAAERPSVRRISQDAGTAVVYWDSQRTVAANDPAAATPLRPFIVVGLTGPVGDVRFERVRDP